MADLSIRFGRDMLVLSSSARSYLERLGEDGDTAMTLLVEPEVYEEFYALEKAVGAQCLVTETAGIAPARLAHSRMEDSGEVLAKAALDVVLAEDPQHAIVAIGPCMLPLDPSSKASLIENRDQYARAARSFVELEESIDAFLLDGFERTTDLKCALMGLRKVTDKPVLASVDLAAYPGPDGRTLAGLGGGSLEEAVSVMGEYGAQVAGFRTAAPVDVACQLARQAVETAGDMPVLVQLDVRHVDPDQEVPSEVNPYFEPDAMVEAAERLAMEGVQFLRAVGAATPSYTGALVGATIGDEVIPTEALRRRAKAMEAVPDSDSKEQPSAESLRAKVNAALGRGTSS